MAQRKVKAGPSVLPNTEGWKDGREDGVAKALEEMLGRDELEGYEPTEEERLGTLAEEWVAQSREMTRLLERMKWRQYALRALPERDRDRQLAGLESQMGQAREELRLVTRAFVDLWASLPHIWQTPASWDVLPPNLRLLTQRLMAQEGHALSGVQTLAGESFGLRKDQEGAG